MDNHLLSLCLSSSSEDESAATSRASKLQQTESQFQHQKSTWNPLQSQTKDAALELKAVAEELYYKRNYTGALETATRVLNESVRMHPSERKELVALQEACKRRFAGLNTV
ncbi:hypothetical protein BDD12DRAFT_812827 [Trichophaea hybrida]|nr:hypothetical protein BDD12DRAFT_812827 [Trichophaea hybrida]